MQTTTKKKQTREANKSLRSLKDYTTNLVLGHGEMSTHKPFFKVPKNKMVVIFVKAGCELGDISSRYLWNTMSKDVHYVQKVLLTQDLEDTHLFGYRMVYPEGSYCPNIFITLTCMSGMKTGVYTDRDIVNNKYDNLPCISSVKGREKISAEHLTMDGSSHKDIYVMYTCLFLRHSDNPLDSVDWGEESNSKARVRAVIRCSHDLSVYARELFDDTYTLFPIRYSPVSRRSGKLMLREYDNTSTVLKTAGDTYWNKVMNYIGMGVVGDTLQEREFTREYMSECGFLIEKKLL
jgi:hypothetical protein